MKRLSLFLLVLVVIVLAVVYAKRWAEHRTSTGVAALMPRDTVAFAHVPDFNGTLDDWHRSDVYQIYLEPAVQEFLHNPQGHPPQPESFGARVNELKELRVKNLFVALTSIANDKPKIIGGFEFGANQATADRIIGSWRSKINPSSKHDRISYQKHEIEVFTETAFSVAMVQDQNWFFASNDVEELKAVLDRADGRLKDSDSLTADASYRSSIKQVPGSYAMFAYFQPRTLVERLNSASKAAGNANTSQITVLQQVRSACAATRFDHGRLHDFVFVQMPKQEQNASLNRNALGLATKSTIAYAAGLIDFTKQAGLLFPTGTPNMLGPAAQRIGEALSAAGITAADWEAAFGSEFDFLSDWTEQSRWPSVLVTTAVKDQSRARKIIDALTQGAGLEEKWEQSDHDGTHYWSLVAASSWLSLRPVMALSDRAWITGLDMNSVAAAIQRAQKPESGLAETDAFRKTSELVPAPTKFFTYIDPGLIYTRIDATLRPFILMGAAFFPAANNFVDLSKVPPTETVTKHLSPIVSSQYYTADGYVAESVGPLTLNQTGIGVAVLGGMGAMAYHRLMPSSPNPLGLVKPGGASPGTSITPKPGRRSAPIAPGSTSASPSPTP